MIRVIFFFNSVDTEHTLTCSSFSSTTCPLQNMQDKQEQKVRLDPWKEATVLTQIREW